MIGGDYKKIMDGSVFEENSKRFFRLEARNYGKPPRPDLLRCVVRLLKSTDDATMSVEGAASTSDRAGDEAPSDQRRH
jgi:hypothetical protein